MTFTDHTEYLFRAIPPNPALNLQCYNLFVVGPILKNERKKKREGMEKSGKDKKMLENSRKKKWERMILPPALLRYN